MSKHRSFVVLLATTWAFTVCFAVWMMFGVTGIPIGEQLGLNSVEFGLLTATPVLTGALFRLPLGIWTDRFGGRRLMLALLLGCAAPVWLSSYATTLWQFLLLGLALGLVGASFSVGTPYVARFFPKEQRGFAMGFFGAGTVGAALNMFLAPALIDAYGWPMVPKVYAAGLGGDGRNFLDLLRTRSRTSGGVAVDAFPASRAAGSACVEILSVLFDRVRRLHGSVDLDATIFQIGIRPHHRAGRPARSLFRPPRRRISRLRGLAVRPFRRP